MTTYDFTGKDVDGTATAAVGATKQIMTHIDDTALHIMSHVVDFSLQNIDTGDGDIAQVLYIPADTTVLSVNIRSITAETADATCNLGDGSDADYYGKALNLDTTAGAMVPKTLTGTGDWDPSDIADGDEEADTITIAGAAIGDKVLVAPAVDLTDLVINATVTLEDTVTVVLANNTGATVEDGTTIGVDPTVWVEKGNLGAVPRHYGSADTIDITATTANGDVDFSIGKFEVFAVCMKGFDAHR